jgi:hypothetical protein
MKYFNSAHGTVHSAQCTWQPFQTLEQQSSHSWSIQEEQAQGRRLTSSWPLVPVENACFQALTPEKGGTGKGRVQLHRYFVCDLLSIKGPFFKEPFLVQKSYQNKKV